MINLSQKNIVRLSKESGFIKDNIEKVLRLTDILVFLFSSRFAKKFALKGGTAINLLYLNLPRLSVVIDLDYTSGDRDDIIKSQAEIREFLQGTMIQKGYSLSPASKRYYALDSFVLQYINNAGNKDNIKIEINYMDRVHVIPLESKQIKNSIVDTDVAVTVLALPELFGSKLAALLDRCKPRDLYDTYGLIKSELIFDNDLLRQCAVLYNCIAGNTDIDHLDFSIMDELTARDIKRMLTPMLSKQDGFDISLAISDVKAFLSELLVLTENEKRFVGEFRKKNYCPDLLFNDKEMATRIKNHPMALWRCKQ